jgi:hypothetical protein
MDKTLWHKFTQHPDLKDLLLSTGDAELIEVFYFIVSSLRYKSHLLQTTRTPVKTPSGE